MPRPYALASWRFRRGLLAATLAGLALTTALAWDPIVGSWHLARGRSLLMVRTPAAALEQLEAAGDLRPRDAEVPFLMARALRRLGRFQESERSLAQAERLGLNPERSHRERILIAAQAGRLREAEPHLPRLLQQAEDDGAEICEAFVLGYFANLRLNEAMRLLDAWAADHPLDAEPYFMRGYAYQATSEYASAIEQYRHGLTLSPGRTEMRRRLADILSEGGEPDAAASEYRRCLSENPQDAAATVGLAKILFRQGDAPAAEDVLRPVLERHSGQPSDLMEAWSLAGEIALAQGRYEDAARHLERAAEFQPYDTKVRYSLAKALGALGRVEEAQGHFRYVAEAEEPLNRMERQLERALREPQNAELRYEIATTMMKYSDPDAATRWLHSVLELNPHHAGARRTLDEYFKRREGARAPNRLDFAEESSSDASSAGDAAVGSGRQPREPQG